MDLRLSLLKRWVSVIELINDSIASFVFLFYTETESRVLWVLYCKQTSFTVLTLYP